MRQLVTWLNKNNLKLQKLGMKFFDNHTRQYFTKAITDTINLRKEKKVVRPDIIHILMEASSEILATDNRKSIFSSLLSIRM